MRAPRGRRRVPPRAAAPSLWTVLAGCPTCDPPPRAQRTSAVPSEPAMLVRFCFGRPGRTGGSRARYSERAVPGGQMRGTRDGTTGPLRGRRFRRRLPHLGRRAALLLAALLVCAGGAAVAALGQATSSTSVQPFVAQGEKLVPSDLHGRESHVGRDIALSQDGDTALI